EIGKFRPRNAVTIGNWTGHLTDCERIEIVIDKDEHAQEPGQDYRAAAFSNALCGPFGKRRRTTRHHHKSSDNSELEQKRDDQDRVPVDRVVNPHEAKNSLSYSDHHGDWVEISKQEAGCQDARAE